MGLYVGYIYKLFFFKYFVVEVSALHVGLHNEDIITAWFCLISIVGVVFSAKFLVQSPDDAHKFLLCLPCDNSLNRTLHLI